MTIHLSQLMPLPLAEQDTSGSQVWGAAQVRFESGASYLVGSPSGKGKSTLLSIFFGLRQDYRGTVSLDGQDPLTISLSEWAILRQQRISMVFQGLRLFPQLSGWDNLLVKNSLTGFRQEAELRNMAHRLGIGDLLTRPCGTWSFGQRQRLAIIRALAQPFEWLLLDEPFSHLDQENIAIAAAMIEEARQAQGAGLILTSLGEEDVMNFDHRLTL